LERALCGGTDEGEGGPRTSSLHRKFTEGKFAAIGKKGSRNRGAPPPERGLSLRKSLLSQSFRIYILGRIIELLE